MAEILIQGEPRKLKSGNISQQLDGLKWALLPEEIQKDINAKWILSFDHRDGHSERAKSPDLDSAQVAYYAAEQAVTALLQERVPFYLATLFHIGRQWKISAELGREARRLQDEKNLTASGESLVAFAKQAGRALDPNLARESVIAFSKAAINQHDHGLVQAQKSWPVWTEEVDDLRKLVVTFGEQAPRHRDRSEDEAQLEWLSTFSLLLFFQQRPSRIRSTLRETGVVFQDGVEAWPPTQTSFLAAPIVFAIASLATRYRSYELDRFFHQWQDLFYDHRRLVRRIEIEPLVRDAEARLFARYGGQSPLTEFSVGKKAASEALVNLLRENEFVDRVQSRWRQEWEATLESVYSFTPVPPSEQALIPARIERALFSADGAIKKAILGHRTPIETFSEYCQRAFEQDWVRVVANSIFRKPDKDKDPSTVNVWTLGDFEALLAEVVRALNNIGYQLVMPKTERLKTLVTKAQVGQPLWDW